MNMRTTASVFMIWSAICVYVDSCTFPSVLEGKTWEDSKKGRPVTFSGNVMIGWNVTAFSTVMNQWECLFNENDIIVSKSSFVFELFPGFPPTTYYVYICMWIVSLDSDKFIYYLLADFVSDFDTRAYKGTDDNLGPCDVCQLSLSLDHEDAKVMTSTGIPSAITIPPQSGPCSGCSCLPTSTISTDSGDQSSNTISTDSGQQSSSKNSTDSGQQSSSTFSTGSNQAKEPAVGFNTVFVAPIVIGISVLIAAVVSVILYKSKKRNSKTGPKKINACTT